MGLVSCFVLVLQDAYVDRFLLTLLHVILNKVIHRFQQGWYNERDKSDP